MDGRSVMLVVALGLAAASCDREEASENASASQAANAAAIAPDPAPVAKPAAPKPAPDAAYVLAGNGLSPGLTFGTAQADAIAAAAAAFGKPSPIEHNDECGEGPMDFVSFGDLQLGFQEGKLAGWSLGGARPALRTAGGLAVGATRSAIGDASVEETSLGQEFFIEDVGGLLSEDGKTIAALWAGYPCQFR